MSESTLSLSTVTEVTHLFEHVEFADMPAIENMKVSTLRLFVQGLTEALRLLDREAEESKALGFNADGVQDGAYFSLRDDAATLQVLGSRPVGKQLDWGSVLFNADAEPVMDDPRMLDEIAKMDEALDGAHVDVTTFGEETRQCSCGLSRDACDYWDDVEDEDGVVLQHGGTQQEFLCRCGLSKLDCDFWDMEWWEHKYMESLLQADTGIEETEE